MTNEQQMGNNTSRFVPVALYKVVACAAEHQSNLAFAIIRGLSSDFYHLSGFEVSN